MKNQSLARTLLNNPGLIALTVPEERLEIYHAAASKIMSEASNLTFKGQVRLKRTFTQAFPGIRPLRFWRVISPAAHPNYGSDLSVQGLRQWGIIASTNSQGGL